MDALPPLDERRRRPVAHGIYIIYLLLNTGRPTGGCPQMNAHPLHRLGFDFHEPRSKDKLTSKLVFRLAYAASGGRFFE